MFPKHTKVIIKLQKQIKNGTRGAFFGESDDESDISVRFLRLNVLAPYILLRKY